MKKEEGITLVALIITIIVLIILAAVTLKTLVVDGVLNLASQGSINYSQAQSNEVSMLNEMSGKLDDTLKQIQDVGIKEEEEKTEPTAIYAKLYTDGTLILSSTDYTDPDRTLQEDYHDISKMEYGVDEYGWPEGNAPGWLNKNEKPSKASNVIIYDKIAPTNTALWFVGLGYVTKLDLSNLDTSNVTNMSCMFSGCSSLQELDLSTFDTGNVTNMSGMFSGCSDLQTLDLSDLDTSSVTNMSGMFSGCSGLETLNLNGINTKSVTDMSWMFQGCSDLKTLNLNEFDTSKVTDMNGMFQECSSLQTLDLRAFDTRNVTDMGEMFAYCKNLDPSNNLGMSNWDVSNVTNFNYMFGIPPTEY